MYWLGKASHFNNLERVIFGPLGDQKLGNTRNSYKVKSGVSQIHLRQLFHFINVRCNYCLQLSLSYPRFLQTGQNRRFFVFMKLEIGFLPNRNRCIEDTSRSREEQENIGNNWRPLPPAMLDHGYWPVWNTISLSSRHSNAFQVPG